MQPAPPQVAQSLQHPNYQMLYQQYLNLFLQQGYDARTAQTFAAQYAQQALIQPMVPGQFVAAGHQVLVAPPTKKSGLRIGNVALFVGLFLFIGVPFIMGFVYVWMSASLDSLTVEEFRVESSTAFGTFTACSDSFVLDYGEVLYCEFDLSRDSNIEITVTLAEGEVKGVNLITMTALNFQDYQDGRSYVYVDDLSATNTTSAFLEGRLESNTYFVVVENPI